MTEAEVDALVAHITTLEVELDSARRSVAELARANDEFRRAEEKRSAAQEARVQRLIEENKRKQAAETEFERRQVEGERMLREGRGW